MTNVTEVTNDRYVTQAEDWRAAIRALAEIDRMRDYPSRTREALASAAADAGVSARRGLRTVAATDALIALRARYPVATLASVDTTKLPLNYHWSSDRPDGLHWDTISDAIAVCDRFLRRHADGDTLLTLR